MRDGREGTYFHQIAILSGIFLQFELGQLCRTHAGKKAVEDVEISLVAQLIK